MKDFYECLTVVDDSANLHTLTLYLRLACFHTPQFLNNGRLSSTEFNVILNADAI